ncbi:MAG: amino-acid N-acetyltransferase [Gammaproteobacteria bacterium]|nr:amino-acid N-acetyltransferase [Gammaproteobacteria bacterium]
MTELTQYARWFRDSTPYISAHRHKTFVVLLGGDAIVHEHVTPIVHDLALLSVLGARLVLVHGARPQIDAAVSAAGLTPRFHKHRRITDEATIEAVQSAVARVRVRIEGLFSLGLPNTPLHNTRINVLSGNLVTARPVGVVDGVDHLFTGRVRRIHHEAIRTLLEERSIVLLSPLGYSPSGQAFNLSSEELATDVAIAMGADKLIAFDDVSRVTTPDGVARSQMTPVELDAVLDTIEANDSTRLRLKELLRASRAGVDRCHLVGFSDDGALLKELFTAQGCGTQISEDGAEHVRHATADDVAAIVELIAPLEATGALVRRSRDRLEQEIERFFVAELDGNVVGCCALYPFEGNAAGELACLATHPGYRDDPIAHGAALVRKVESEARRLGLKELFLLTTQTRDWFKEQGFADAAVDDLPAPKKALYNYQRNSIVMTKKL